MRRNSEYSFLKYIEKQENGCWHWTSDKMKNGYGRFSFNGKRVLAHRYSFKFFNGFIKDDMHVCHTCDNPKCVNPLHLWLGTDADNLRDMREKGRCNNQNSLKKECKNGHKFNKDNNSYNKIRKSTGKSYRVCRICEQKYFKEKYLKMIGRPLLPPRTKCNSGIHDWIKENIYIRPDGEKNCHPCKLIKSKLRRYKLKMNKVRKAIL